METFISGLAEGNLEFNMKKILKMTGADMFFMEHKRVMKLWEIRESFNYLLSEAEINRSFKLLDENKKDFDEVNEKYSWF